MVTKLSELEMRFGGNLTPNGMKDIDYKNQNVHFLRFAGASCPICGHKTWCQVNATGTKIICQRVKQTTESINGFKYVKDIKAIGGYLYKLVNLDEAVKFDANAINYNHTFPMASPKVTDTMYRLLLQAYPLTQSHLENLKKRGLSDEDINLHHSRGFGSFYLKRADGKPYFIQAKLKPSDDGKIICLSRWNNVLKKYKLPENLWHGVPGFYLSTVSFRGQDFSFPNFSTVNGKNEKHAPEGMLIPYYDEYNRIRAFQIRIDHSKKYAVIKQGLRLNEGDLKVYINDDTYSVYCYAFGKKEMIAKGKLDGKKEVTLSYGVDVMKENYTFEVSSEAKYYWVSSLSEKDGADTTGKWPVQVAYNPTVAQLNPNNPEERQCLQKYIDKPKAIWVTEGGLKGYITAMKLSKAFTKEQLDDYGRDVLAVAGVNSYRKFLPMLKKLHVTTVTIAYDMDMLQNDQVADNYSNLINMLHENGFKVQLAVWQPDKAKGIDDALSAGIEVQVTPYKQLSF